ncbi:MAG: phospholipase D-like domain-containing protein [Parachlamydiaceae bacterium]
MNKDILRRPWRRYLASAVLSLFFLFSMWALDSRETVSTTLSENHVGLYANQLNDDLTQLFSSAINEAKDSVLLVVYSFTDKEIIRSIKNKSDQGVPIKVICDAKASPYIDSKLGSKVNVTRRFGPGLMHQKILVIDRQKIWIGSANMTAESLRLHGNLVCSIDSAFLAEEIIAKADTLHVEGHSTPQFKQIVNIGQQPIEMWFLPDNKNGALRLKSLLRAAKKTVRVAMFTWTRYDLAKEVIAAARRGVDTEVVIDHYSGKGSSKHVVEMLHTQGVNVRLSRGGPLLHHKFLYIDEAILVNGSANWTKAAFTQNDDCFIVMHGLTLEQNKKMHALWDVIWAEAEDARLNP